MLTALRRKWRELATAAASTLLCLAVAEGLCRALEVRRPRPQVAESIADWAAWDGEFYTVRQVAGGSGPSADYNADGLRDRAHARTHPPRRRRLACLGDSTTMGWGIRPEEAFPQQFQERLERAGRRFEVFNVGLPGWTTRQERIAYERIARRYAMDDVLVTVCLNDLPELLNNLARPPRWLAAAHERSALVRRVVGAEERTMADVRELFEQGSPRAREAYGRFAQELRRLHGLVKADGARLGVAVLPFAFQLEPGAPAPVPQNVIGAFCEEEGIPFLDLLPSLRRAGGTPFIDEDHLSSHGAGVVADALLASPLLIAAPADGDAQEGARPSDNAPASLVAALADEDPVVRWRAAERLGAIRPLDSLAALTSIAADGQHVGAADAAFVLGRLGPAAGASAPALAHLATTRPMTRLGTGRCGPWASWDPRPAARPLI